MAGENKIDYIELPAKDPAVAREFFEKLFGWEFVDYGPDYTAFNDGRIDGGFFRSDKVSTTDNGSVLVVFYLADLKAGVERVTDLGGTISKEIFSFPGGNRFHFNDPHGNEYAVWSDQ
jgi:predicted enzyme related to lactoylglutathione lyase